MHAIQHSNGTFEFGNARYRLVERGDALFEVVGEQDGSVAGRLRMTNAFWRAPRIEVLPGAAAPEVVNAISRLLGTPRGALPLQ